MARNTSKFDRLRAALGDDVGLMGALALAQSLGIILIAAIRQRWVIADRLLIKRMASAHEIPSGLRQILYNRGNVPAQQLTNMCGSATPGCRPKTYLAWPRQLTASLRHFWHQEPIAVYGDYDADGVTAPHCWSWPSKIKCNVQGYIPDRFRKAMG